MKKTKHSKVYIFFSSVFFSDTHTRTSNICRSAGLCRTENIEQIQDLHTKEVNNKQKVTSFFLSFLSFLSFFLLSCVQEETKWVTIKGHAASSFHRTRGAREYGL